MKSLALGSILLALAAFGCDGAERSAEAQPSSAATLVADGALLLDVRTPGEFADGHVQGALNIPVQELEARVAELDASRPVVVYCRSGNRSGTAAGMLRARGFEVTDLGPMSAWPNADEIVR
jgi:phage shock protein E